MVVGQDGTMRFYDIPTRTQLGDPISIDPGNIPSAALRGDGMAAAAVVGGGIVSWTSTQRSGKRQHAGSPGGTSPKRNGTNTSATSPRTPPPAPTIQPKPDRFNLSFWVARSSETPRFAAQFEE